jgi:hypothetical protein
MQEQSQLVGGRCVARGAVGRQVGLERFDMVLRLAALAIDPNLGANLVTPVRRAAKLKTLFNNMLSQPCGSQARSVLP